MHVDAGSDGDLITTNLMAPGTMTVKNDHQPKIGQFKRLPQPKNCASNILVHVCGRSGANNEWRARNVKSNAKEHR